MEDANHRVRGSVDRRSRRPRLARVDQADPAELDRSERRRADPFPRAVDRPAHQCLHDAPRHDVRRDLHGARARASARRRADARGVARRNAPGLDGRSGDALRRRRGVPAARGVAHRRRAPGRVASEDRRLHRRVRDEPCDQSVDPRVHRGLRADGLRHRGDHGRAGPGRARLGVRRGLRAADRAHGATARRVRRQGLRRRGPRDQQRVPRRSGRRGREAQDHRLARRERIRRRHGHLPVARLAVQPSAVLGRAVPDPVRRDGPADRGARVDAAGAASRAR